MRARSPQEAIAQTFIEHQGKDWEFKTYNDINTAIRALQEQLLPHLDEDAQLQADSKNFSAVYLTLQTVGHLPDRGDVLNYQQNVAAGQGQ